mmetsp:Transcript_127376/g.291249  ORF Transcript_127376/g.291249 Transcript_127376/m.291249 type:complete len:99 (+) Transcript_127376:338-634(+)
MLAIPRQIREAGYECQRTWGNEQLLAVAALIVIGILLFGTADAPQIGPKHLGGALLGATVYVVFAVPSALRRPAYALDRDATKSFLPGVPGRNPRMAQ